MGMVTRGAGAKAGAGAGSSPKGSGAGQLAKVDGAGLGWGGAGRALGALARLSTGSGGLFLELGVLMGSRASGALGTSSVEAPSSRTAALSRREGRSECGAGPGPPEPEGPLQPCSASSCAGPGTAPSLGLSPTNVDPNVVLGSLGSKPEALFSGFRSKHTLAELQLKLGQICLLSLSFLTCHVVSRAAQLPPRQEDPSIQQVPPAPTPPLSLGQAGLGQRTTLGFGARFPPAPSRLGTGLLGPWRTPIFAVPGVFAGLPAAALGAWHQEGWGWLCTCRQDRPGSGPGLHSPSLLGVVCHESRDGEEPMKLRS